MACKEEAYCAQVTCTSDKNLDQFDENTSAQALSETGVGKSAKLMLQSDLPELYEGWQIAPNLPKSDAALPGTPLPVAAHSPAFGFHLPVWLRLFSVVTCVFVQICYALYYIICINCTLLHAVAHVAQAWFVEFVRGSRKRRYCMNAMLKAWD